MVSKRYEQTMKKHISKLAASFKKMHDQKMKERAKNFDTQSKQLKALKKGGKSKTQAEEEFLRGKQSKLNKQQKKGKRGAAQMADEGRKQSNCRVYALLFYR